MHYFLLQINSLAEVKMCADDTSILASHTVNDDFMKMINLLLLYISKWFQGDYLSQNTQRTSIIRFTLTKLSHSLNLIYADQDLTELDTLRFLSLHLMWKPHTDFLLCKLGTACFVTRRISNALRTNSIKNPHSYFHPIIKYDIILWAN
jgi:hypothetical protein